MKYKVGDKVKLKSKEGLDEIERQLKGMALNPEAYDLAGAECAIYNIVDGGYIFDVSPWVWSENMIEGLVEEETKPEYEDEVNGEYYSTPKYLVRPSGYQFVDENGNVINATKIVLEKKKKEYPKTYGECCKVLDWNHRDYDRVGYKSELLCKLQVLLLCRDVYWKIAGEEMGLGKPWEPSDSDYITGRYCIFVHQGNIICSTPAEDCPLTFPTEEIRDAFYENFKELIESVKELL